MIRIFKNRIILKNYENFLFDQIIIVFRLAFVVGNRGVVVQKNRFSLVVKMILAETWALQRKTFERRTHWERIMVIYII